MGCGALVLGSLTSFWRLGNKVRIGWIDVAPTFKDIMVQTGGGLTHDHTGRLGDLVATTGALWYGSRSSLPTA